jgi:hypothetical protein
MTTTISELNVNAPTTSPAAPIQERMSVSPVNTRYAVSTVSPEQMPQTLKNFLNSLDDEEACKVFSFFDSNPNASEDIIGMMEKYRQEKEAAQAVENPEEPEAGPVIAAIEGMLEEQEQAHNEVEEAAEEFAPADDTSDSDMDSVD